MSRAHTYFRILYLGECKLTHYFDAKGAQIFQNTLFRGVQTFIIILMSGVFRATPFARLIFHIFFKGFRKEINQLSLVFFAFQNFSGKIWSLEFTASSSKSLEGFRKGLRKGSTKKGIEKQI